MHIFTTWQYWPWLVLSSHPHRPSFLQKDISLDSFNCYFLRVSMRSRDKVTLAAPSLVRRNIELYVINDTFLHTDIFA